MLSPRPALQTPADEAGFTLIELLVVAVLIIVIAGVAANGVIVAFRTTQESQDRIAALAELQKATERIAREVRVADGSDYPAGTEGQLLGTAADDIQLDVVRGGNRVRYRYWRPAATPDVLLECRQAYTPPGTPCGGGGPPPIDPRPAFVDDLANGATPVFTYLDADGQPATGEDITRVRITLLRALPRQGPLQAATVVQLRNAAALEP